MRSELYDLLSTLEEETGEKSTTALASCLVARLEEQAARGDNTATPKLRQIRLHGATALTRDWFASGRVLVGYDGSTHRIAARVGIPVEVEQDADDEPPVQWQHPLLFELSWPEYEAHVERLRKSVQRVSAELVIKEAVLALQQRFPASRTPLQAMQEAGIDPAEFNVNAQQQVSA